ncbi:MAG TPA: CBS domain-containing protein [Acidimicrobiia bacterium]|jgi:CBS domain-containing protein
MQLAGLVSGAADLIGAEATLVEAATMMVERSIDAFAVVDGRNLVGLFTEHDLVSAVAGGADLDSDTVADWMAESPDTFPPDATVDDSVAWLMETGYRHLPVYGDGELLGIVTIRDLMWALATR